MAALVSVGSVLAGCLRLPVPNQAFPADGAQVRAALASMRDDPSPPPRPIVVISGYRAPPMSATGLADTLRELTGAEDVLAVSFPFGDDIPPLADRLVQAVADRFGSGADGVSGIATTAEVDVVAISMGGLVARAAAADADAVGRTNALRLDIHTLYTLGTPHRGARLARYIHFDKATRQMIPGSAFLAVLDGAREQARGTPLDYRIVPYAVLRDSWVGATRSAPPDMHPIWTPGRLVLSHHLISLERRIHADLARRLRGEQPLGRPSAPPRD